MEVQKTISYQDSGNKWSGHWPYAPDMMEGMNNRFYSFRDGELYEHDSGPVNTFYGIYYPSVLEVIFNDMPDSDKVWNTLMQEGDEPWEVEIETNMTNSIIKVDEFNLRESRWFAYMRRNEEEIDFKALSSVGIGEVVASNGTAIEFKTTINERLSHGDVLYQIQADTTLKIGVVSSIVDNFVIVDSLESLPTDGLYCFGHKGGRIEGSRMRGYYMKVTLTSRAQEIVELFAVNVNYDKSFV